MTEIEDIILGYRREADVDVVGLWQIASSVSRRVASKDQNDVRRISLQIVRGLLELDVYPGDYEYGSRISFWAGETASLVGRVESEWIAQGMMPNLEHPICWFALRHPESDVLVRPR